MNKSTIARVGFAGFIAVLAGCSSADEGGGTGGSTSKSTKTPVTNGTSGSTDQQQTSTDETTPAPADACVPEGTKANSIGVGSYCQTAADCKTTGTFCTAGQAPKGAEFCTAFCATDADCGEGAKCYAGDPRGKGCVPIACIPKS